MEAAIWAVISSQETTSGVDLEGGSEDFIEFGLSARSVLSFVVADCSVFGASVLRTRSPRTEGAFLHIKRLNKAVELLPSFCRDIEEFIVILRDFVLLLKRKDGRSTFVVVFSALP